MISCVRRSLDCCEKGCVEMENERLRMRLGEFSEGERVWETEEEDSSVRVVACD